MYLSALIFIILYNNYIFIFVMRYIGKDIVFLFLIFYVKKIYKYNFFIYLRKFSNM